MDSREIKRRLYITAADVLQGHTPDLGDGVPAEDQWKVAREWRDILDYLYGRGGLGVHEGRIARTHRHYDI